MPWLLPVATSALIYGHWQRKAFSAKPKNGYHNVNTRGPSEVRFTILSMRETNDYRPSNPHPTPPPKLVPTSLPPSTPLDEAEAELDVLQTLNDSLSAQVISLSTMLAERGMVELWAHKWADLSRAATMEYEPGKYMIQIPEVDDPELCVKLLWEPGQILLCEAYQRTEANMLSFPLPTVRLPAKIVVQPPPTGTIPPRPKTERGEHPWDQHQAPSDAMNAYTLEWWAYLEPYKEAASRQSEQRKTATLADESALSYLAIQLLQERRTKPRKENTETVLANLEKRAKIFWI